MGRMTFAAGMAAGYVLGTRAGRETYDKIAQNTRRMADHPAVGKAQNRVKELVKAGGDMASSKITSKSQSAGQGDTAGTGPGISSGSMPGPDMPTGTASGPDLDAATENMPGTGITPESAIGPDLGAPTDDLPGTGGSTTER